MEVIMDLSRKLVDVLEKANSLASWYDSADDLVRNKAALALYELVNERVSLEKIDDARCATRSFLGWGLALLLTGKPEEAIEKCSRVIKLEPRSELAFGLRGASKSLLGRDEEAIDDYDVAISIDPSHLTMWYFFRGFSKFTIGDTTAVLDFDRSLFYHGDFSSYTYRALIYHQQYRYAEARNDYSAALDQLEAIPSEELGVNELKHLIGASWGLTELEDIDRTEDVIKYSRLAQEQGIVGMGGRP